MKKDGKSRQKKTSLCAILFIDDKQHKKQKRGEIIMTKNNLQFKLEFSEEEMITPYGGLGLYGELYKSIGVERAIQNIMTKPGSGSGYEANAYVYPITMMLLGGGRYIEDIRKIKVDKGLREIMKMDVVPSGDAIGDWLRRESPEKMESLQEVNDQIIRSIIRKTDGELTLDIDATAIEAAKYEAAYTYKGHKGYMPMLGFIAGTGCCIGHEFREGNDAPAARNYEFTKGICDKVKKWGQRIRYFRSDSAGYQAKLFNYVNKHEIRYTITVDKDIAIKREIKRIKTEEWKPVRDKSGIRTGREYAEFIHSMNGSDHAFRVIVQRWENPQRDLFETEEPYCYHGVATNFTEGERNSEEVIWWHNGRSNAENYNKEVKLGFNLEYMPSGEFGGNGVWFGLGILAYNLFIASKIFLFPQSWRNKTIGTIRWQFIQMAGRVIMHARDMIVRVSGIMRETFELYRSARWLCRELQQTE